MKLPSMNPTDTGICTSNMAQWIGDGTCDDQNNHLQCNYDGGDCCGPNVNTDYCSQCLCLGIASKTSPSPTTINPITTTIAELHSVSTTDDSGTTSAGIPCSLIFSSP